MRNVGLVIFAIVSLMVHVAGAAIFLSSPEEIQEERGAGTVSLEIGDLFDSAASQEVLPDILEAKRPVTEQVDPVAARHAIPVKEFSHQDVTPVEMKPATEVKPLETRQARVVDTPLVEELHANQTLTQPDIVKPDDMPIVTHDETKVLAPGRVEQAKAVEMPLPRSAIKPKKIEPVRVSKDTSGAKPEEAKKKKRKKPASKASRAARKGGVTANAKGRKGATGGNGGKSKTADGSALTSNYKGKVTARLRRAARRLRWPRGAHNVSVSFSVAPSGLLNGVRIVGSSGNSSFDTKIVRTIKRAAPFGKFPQGMVKRRINFGVTFSDR